MVNPLMTDLWGQHTRLWMRELGSPNFENWRKSFSTLPYSVIYTDEFPCCLFLLYTIEIAELQIVCDLAGRVYTVRIRLHTWAKYPCDIWQSYVNGLYYTL
jgi:hypothetical protein